MRQRLLLVLVTCLCLAGIESYANTVTVTIPDPGAVGFIDFGVGNASVTYSNVTFSQSGALSDSTFFNVGTMFSGAPAVLSSQGQTFGVANILISLPVNVSSFALDYGTFFGSAVTFAMSNGGSMTLGSTGSGYVVPDIFSVSGGLFNWVLVTSSDAVLNINNISYTPATSPTPEPSSLLLLGSGLFTLGGAFVKKIRS